jgi:hypothetical protein
VVVTRRDLRIGYFVTAYKEQSHLRRLLRTLLRWDPTGEVALHFDRSKATLDLGGLANDRLQLLPEWTSITWGDASYLTALLRGLRWWSHRGVDWVVILSGQDYPVRPSAELREFLGRSGRNSFVWGGKLGIPPWQYRVADLDAEQQRYFLRWGKIPRMLWHPPARPLTERALRLAQDVLPGGLAVRQLPHNDRPSVGWRPAQGHPFSDDWHCCLGWDYFAVDQHAISVLVGDDHRVVELRQWYERTIIPTESFFITVLRGHPDIRSGAKALHYARREARGHPHPVVLENTEFDEICNSERFFARKFDSGSRSLLDRIDAELLGHCVENQEK